MSDRKKTPDEIINTHMGFSMAAGALPIPLLDIAAVTAIQVSMLKDLADYYGIDYDADKSKSLITALLSSTIGTTLGRTGASIVKALPGIGTLLGLGSQVILSGASTYAVGKVFDKHFREDGNLSNFSVNSFQDFFEDMFRNGREEARKKDKGQHPEDRPLTPEERAQQKEEIWDTLNKLKDLQEQGVITETEYQQAKDEALKKLYSDM